MALMFFKSIIAKQFEGSWIKHMCIFHVLKVRGVPGQRGGFCAVYGVLGQCGSPPGYAPDKPFSSSL